MAGSDGTPGCTGTGPPPTNKTSRVTVATTKRRQRSRTIRALNMATSNHWANHWAPLPTNREGFEVNSFSLGAVWRDKRFVSGFGPDARANDSVNPFGLLHQRS